MGGWVGLGWSGGDSSGVKSIVWRDEWEQAQATPMKERLITYNSEDCAALELVAHAVAQACQKDAGSVSETAGRLEVVVADKLDSKVTMWPNFTTSIQSF